MSRGKVRFLMWVDVVNGPATPHSGGDSASDGPQPVDSPCQRKGRTQHISALDHGQRPPVKLGSRE